MAFNNYSVKLRFVNVIYLLYLIKGIVKGELIAHTLCVINANNVSNEHKNDVL